MFKWMRRIRRRPSQQQTAGPFQRMQGVALVLSATPYLFAIFIGAVASGDAMAERKVVTIMAGTPVCSKQGADTFADLHKAHGDAFIARDSEEMRRVNIAIGEAQDRMCEIVPCCDDVSGVLTGRTYKHPKLDAPFLEAVVRGHTGYILPEDIVD